LTLAHSLLAQLALKAIKVQLVQQELLAQQALKAFKA
jgi:hypothetical protein